MPINSPHPDVAKQSDDWERCRDTIEGEQAIRRRIQKYLPPPPGLAGQATTVLANLQNFENTKYSFYTTFARWPVLVGPSVNGMQGMIHAKPPEITLPERMEYLREIATPDGDSLNELFELMTREVISTGRISLLGEIGVNTEKTRDNVFLCPYIAEALTNWQLMKKIEGGHPHLVVLAEKNLEPKSEDNPYEYEEKTQWRELAIVDDKYVVRLWEADEDSSEPKVVAVEGADEDGWLMPQLKGSQFARIPIEVINAVDRGFDFGPIPSLPMVTRALSIFRLTADYYRSLFQKGDPQPWIAGIDPGDKPTQVGGTEIWAFSHSDAKAGYLDIDGNGIPLQAAAIADEYDRFELESGQLRGMNDSSAAESGVAVKARQSMQVVTLKSLVVNVAEGLQQSLRMVAQMLGIAEQSALDSITVVPNLEFTEPTLTAAEAQLWGQARLAGGVRISAKTLHKLLKRGNIPVQDEFDDEEADIASDPPPLSGLGGVFDEEPPDDDDKAGDDEDDNDEGE